MQKPMTKGDTSGLSQGNNVGKMRIEYQGLGRKKAPTRSLEGAFLYITSLTITYFHTGCSTIIGAELFHGPVRDGKGWDHLAMVIRH